MSDVTWAAIQLAVRILLALVFVVMGVNHFAPKAARVMAEIIPPSFHRPGVPSPLALVRFTGLCEIAGGVGLLVEPVRLAAGIALAVFLVAVFPANAHAARHPERFGRIAIPLVPRLVAQVVLIALVLFAGWPL
ncbi:DoxX family membrane protein [Clavibacter sp. Sh2088]|uniref:DoxX family protein n=1 Tax=Clavibacter sp. Sh2088 TaxID=3397676 RepID=UPI0039DF7248